VLVLLVVQGKVIRTWGALHPLVFPNYHLLLSRWVPCLIVLILCTFFACISFSLWLLWSCWCSPFYYGATNGRTVNMWKMPPPLVIFNNHLSQLFVTLLTNPLPSLQWLELFFPTTLSKFYLIFLKIPFVTFWKAIFI